MQPPTGSAEDEYRYVGESKEIVRQALMDNETPPELIGRLLNAIIPFSHLPESAIEQIITDRLLQITRNFGCRYDSSLARFLLDRYDQRYGARAIVDYMECDLRDELLDLKVEGQVIYKDDSGMTRVTSGAVSGISYQRRLHVQDQWSAQLTHEALKTLQTTLEHRIKGQSNAIRRVVGTLRLVTQHIADQPGGIRAGSPPLTSIFFAGPTGVGKTEVFRALADFFHPAIQSRQFNMTEYRMPFGLARFFGELPYERHGKGELGQFLFNNPASIILFDEFEKADPEVQQSFLTILEGKLTTGDGTSIDLSQTIFVFTSNAGSEELQLLPPARTVEEGRQREHLCKELVHRGLMMAGARPELIGRLISTIVTFQPLGEAEISQIIALRLSKLEQRRKVRFDTSVTDFLLDRYDRRYGARALVEFIERDLQVDLSELMDNGQIENLIIYKDEAGTTKATSEHSPLEKPYQRFWVSKEGITDVIPAPSSP
ncbi:MAG: AAA domain-containing protein [Chloroflexaceae bacterium]|nr:AAA domain-containing protein [Chloroflexaceae bacterium]